MSGSEEMEMEIEMENGSIAVENAHDENILRHMQDQDKDKYLNLSFMLSMMVLAGHFNGFPDIDGDTAPEDIEEMRQQLLTYKAEVDALDRNETDYYEKKEQLIYKIFCKIYSVPEYPM